MRLVNTFDVEPWWTTVPPVVPVDEWERMADRSEVPTRLWMDLCDRLHVKCTFFVVGRHALRFPSLVREIAHRGHEVGCHSLEHEDVATVSDAEFRARTRRCKAILEDVSGAEVVAFRAPSFSFPPDRAGRLFGILAELGFRIDSSITTAGRIYGGGFTREEFPRPMSLLERFGVDIVEIPVPGVRLFGRELQVFGGGYLRLMPMGLLEALHRREDYQVLYVHPHDFDPDLPRLPGSGVLGDFRRRIRLGDLSDKVRQLFALSEVLSCGQLAAGVRP
jgi:polysaccharide deacetylase family protein (PEP-CTERM system associated)